MTSGFIIENSHKSLNEQGVGTERAMILRNLSSLYAHPSIVLWRFAEILAIRETLRGDDLLRPVVDLGSGDGKVSLVAFGQNEVDIGIDLSRSMTRKAWGLRSYKSLIVADGSMLPIRSGSVGMVFSNSVFEHIPNIEDVLGETRRVLTKGGFLFLTVPNDKFSRFLSIASLLETLRLGRLARTYSRLRNEKLHHHHCESIEWWSRELSALGFRPRSLTEHLPHKAVIIWDLLAILAYPFEVVATNGRFRTLARVIIDKTRDFRFSVASHIAPVFLPDGSGAVLAISAIKAG